MLWKCFTQYVSKFGKPSSGHRTGKCQSLSQFPRRTVLKTVQITRQLHLSPMPVRLCWKSFKVGFSISWTKTFQMFRLGLERQRNQKSNWQHLLDHWKSKRVPEKHLFLLYWLWKSLWLCGSQQTVENSEIDGNTRPPCLPLEKPVCRSGSNS